MARGIVRRIRSNWEDNFEIKQNPQGLFRNISRTGTVTFTIFGKDGRPLENACIDKNGKWLAGKDRENKVLKRLFKI